MDAGESSTRSNDHLPANSILVTVRCRRFRSRSAKGARFSAGISNARSPSKLSAVTQPCAASSPSACSTREGSSPVCRTISLKNNAPARDKVCRTCSVSGRNPEGASASDRTSQCARFSRAKSETGLDRSGEKARTFWIRGGVRRPQPIRPVKQSRSSHCGVYSLTRRASTCGSHAAAGNWYPSSISRTAATPSGPSARCSASARCQANRKR